MTLAQAAANPRSQAFASASGALPVAAVTAAQAGTLTDLGGSLACVSTGAAMPSPGQTPAPRRVPVQPGLLMSFRQGSSFAQQHIEKKKYAHTNAAAANRGSPTGSQPAWDPV
ncbi:MAG TPA: hypothetical protein VG253_00425 [Streptosporangiaceae bacterium]|nr:hypothetical protein [Streptosporangiaceae bacterium]